MNANPVGILLVWELLYLVVPLFAQPLAVKDTPPRMMHSGYAGVIPFVNYSLPVSRPEPPLPIDFLEFREKYHKPLERFIIHDFAPGIWSQKLIWPGDEGKKTGSLANKRAFRAFYNAASLDEKSLVRQAWDEALGIDVWFPYYKAKELEGWVRNRLSVRILRMKGEPSFEKNKATYAFKVKF